MPAPQVNSTVTIAPPPPNFTGDLTAIFALLSTNIRVRNPSGYNTFIVSNIAPTSDSGPWLKDGNQWYVWDTGTATYVPQFLADAFARDIPEGGALPAGATASGMFFLTSPGAAPVLFRWTAGAWRNIGNLSGTTAARPASPPAYSKYFDTTIGTELFFKPGFGWVTTDGVIGDTKFVRHATEALALQYNPGWEIDGPVKGRTVAGSNGVVNGFTDRDPEDTFGSETHTLTVPETPAHTHGVKPSPGGARIAGYGGSNADNARTNSDQGGGDNNQGVLANGLVVLEDTGGGEAHNNIQPTIYRIPLRKVQ